MFVLNGNRRPSPSFSVVLKAAKGMMVSFQNNNTLMNGVLSVLNSKVMDVNDIQCLFDVNYANISLKWLKGDFPINPATEYVAMNIVHHKRLRHPEYGSVAHFYVLPKNILTEPPKQFKTHFSAIMNKEAPSDPIYNNGQTHATQVFSLVGVETPVYVQNQKEADFYVEINGGQFVAVDGFIINGRVHVDNEKIRFTPVDTGIHSITVVKDNDTVFKKSESYHVLKFENIVRYVTVNKYMPKLPAGLYHLRGDLSGFVLVEDFDGFAGKRKFYHFIEADDKRLPELIDTMGISKA